MRRLQTAIRLALLTFLSLLLALPPIPAWGEEATRTERTVRLAVISDVHYVDPGGIPADGTQGKAAFKHAESAELRIMEKIDPVLVKALDGAVASNPDALLVSGDLMSNGEYANAQKFASRLKEAKGRLGDDTGIYVVNGNHDMNMSYAAKFTNEGVEAGRRITQQDWRTIFDGLGYNGNQDFSYFADANPGAATANAMVRNSGGLSYATEIAEGVTLIALDTAQYSNDDKALFNQAQVTPGSVSPELLSWAAAEARSAKAKGNLVLVMTHHAMLPHYTEQNEDIESFMQSQVIPNWQQVADTLADAGVTAYISGHTHSNDISKYVTPAGNTIYDINTAGLAAYPCSWRTVDINISGTGADATYDFDINTDFITNAEGIADLQAYAYEATGLSKDNIEPMLDYLIRLTLSDIKNFSEPPYGNGLAGFLNKALNVHPEDAKGSIGNLAITKLKELLEKLDATLNVDRIGTITIKYKDTTPDGIVRLDVTLDDGKQAPSAGVFSFDFSGMSAAIDKLLNEVNATYIETVGNEGNYSASTLQKDLNKLASGVILDVDKDPLDPQDPNSRILTILNEAYQAYAHGDEMSFVWPGLRIGSAAELAQRREAWRGLLMSDAFVDTTRSVALEHVKSLTDEDVYPTIATLLDGLSLIPADHGGQNDWFIMYEPDNPFGSFDMLMFAGTVLGSVQNGTNLVELVNILSNTLNPIPADFVRDSLAQRAANMQRSFTVDGNIPNDTDWAFHSVLFDACGGTVSPSADLTVEGGRLGRATIGLALPTPTRDGRAFLGWFTAEEGGQAIDANADYTTIKRIYAHWDPPAEITYSCVAGDKATWRYDSMMPLQFTFARSEDNDQALAHFTGILIDGKAVEDTGYATQTGGVVISLNRELLCTLGNGTHTLTACFDDGDDATATFTVDGSGGALPDFRPGHGAQVPSYYSGSSYSYDYVETGAVSTGTNASTSSSATSSKTSRIAGPTRYDTMASIVSSSFPSSAWVIVASGESYADALSAVAVAGAHRAPVVLTTRDALSDQAREQIVRLGSTHAIIVGGPSAVSDAVEASVRELVADTTRIFGADRTATSVAAMGAARSTQGTSDTVVIATGYAFADALSIGSWSYASVSPIVLTGANGMLSDEAIQAIRNDSGIKNVVIVGGTAAVSDAVKDQLGAGYAFERLGGADRIATSALVASYGSTHGLNWSRPFIASGQGFADALAGAAAAGSNGSVLLLVTSPEGATIEALRAARTKVSEVKVLGGPAAVSDTTFTAIDSAIK